MNPPQKTNPPHIGLWVVLIWWISRYFFGPDYHDGVFYTGDALHRITPDSFSKDIFFQHSSQGDFSIFGFIYAKIIDSYPINLAGWLIVLAGKLIWVTGAWKLVATLTKDKTSIHWLAALALFLLLPSTYDGPGFFKSSEPFATPRIWGEGFSLLAIAYAMNHQTWRAFITMALASLLHPLMALPPLLMTTGLFLRRKHAPFIIIAATLLLVFFNDTAPINRLFLTFDSPWWSFVATRNSYLMPENWPLSKGSLILTMLMLCIRVAHIEQIPLFKRLAQITALTTIMLLALWLLGTGTHNILIVQLQLWRVLWISQLLIPALWIRTLPPIAEWKAHHGIQILTVIAALTSHSPVVHGCVILGIALSSQSGQYFLSKYHHCKNLGLAAAGSLLIMSLPSVYQEVAQELRAAEQPVTVISAIDIMSQQPLLTLPAFILLAWVTLKHRLSLMIQAVMTTVFLGGTAYISIYSLEENQQKFVNVDTIQSLIPPGSVVYWDSGLAATWLVLKRSSYASFQQGAGSVFSRDLAVTLAQRLDFLRSMGVPVPGPQPVEKVPPEINFKGACGDKHLDFLLLEGSHNQATHQLPHPYAPYTHPIISIFDCKNFRDSLASAP